MNEMETMGNILDAVSEMMMVEEDNLLQILDFKDAFTQKLEDEKEKLPYTMNVLDEGYFNENSHSRILVKLLKYRKNKRYPLLESFFSHLREPFKSLKIEHPIFTAEKDRIDARIRFGKKSSVIIENKIHGAKEQERQIGKYIDIEKSDGYSIENIHVLYLTSQGGTASEFSIGNELKIELGDRYRDISYKRDILPWLEKLPDDSCDDGFRNEKLLQGAIVQYVNYIKGLCNMRKGEEEMNNKMAELVKEKMQLAGQNSSSKEINIILEYKAYVTELQNYLVDEERKLLFSSLKNLKEALLKTQIDGIEVSYSDNGDFGKIKTAVIFKPKCWKDKYSIRLEFGGELSSLYFGIFNSENNSDKEFIQYLSGIFQQKHSASPCWPYWFYFMWGMYSQELVENIENGQWLKKIEDYVRETYKSTKELTELQNM